MSRYTIHKEKWKACTLCNLCERRKRVVLCRGKLPAPILFIGEAPGPSEDVLGIPFCGPAGKLLDQIISRTIDSQWDYAMTNLVACIPKDETNTKFAEPPPEAIKACEKRLEELILMCNPKLIIAVGELANKWLPKMQVMDWMWTGTFVCIQHPAAILRADIMQRGLLIQRCIATLEDALEGL